MGFIPDDLTVDEQLCEWKASLKSDIARTKGDLEQVEQRAVTLSGLLHQREEILADFESRFPDVVAG